MSSHSILAIKRFFSFFLSLKADDDISFFVFFIDLLDILYNIYKALLYVLDTAYIIYTYNIHFLFWFAR